MRRYSEAAWERAMKVQKVILRAMAKRTTWWQAAEILGISDWSLRRWRRRHEQHGYDGLFARRQGVPSPRRVPMEVAQEALRHCQSKRPATPALTPSPTASAGGYPRYPFTPGFCRKYHSPVGLVFRRNVTGAAIDRGYKGHISGICDAR